MILTLSIVLVGAGWVLVFSVGGGVAGVSTSLLGAALIGTGIGLLVHHLRHREAGRRTVSR